MLSFPVMSSPSYSPSPSPPPPPPSPSSLHFLLFRQLPHLTQHFDLTFTRKVPRHVQKEEKGKGKPPNFCNTMSSHAPFFLFQPCALFSFSANHSQTSLTNAALSHFTLTPHSHRSPMTLAALKRLRRFRCRCITRRCRHCLSCSSSWSTFW